MKTFYLDSADCDPIMNDKEALMMGPTKHKYEYPDPDEGLLTKSTASYNAWYAQETGEVLQNFDETKRGCSNSLFRQEGCDRVNWNKTYWYDECMDADKADVETYHACPLYTKAIKALHEAYYHTIPSMNGSIKWKQTHIYEPWGRGTPAFLRKENHNMGDLTSAPKRIFHLECVTDQPYPTREGTRKWKGKRFHHPRKTAPGSMDSRVAPRNIAPSQSPNVEFALDPLLAKSNSEDKCIPLPDHPVKYLLTPVGLLRSTLLPTPLVRQEMPPPSFLYSRRTRPDRTMRNAMMRGLKFGTQVRKSAPKTNSNSLKLQQARKRCILRNMEKSQYREWKYRTFMTSPLSMGDGS